jgi:hypothetical protein
MGDFAATAFGEEIIPVLMAPRVALMSGDREAIPAAEALRDALRLELRDPDGRAIPTLRITITDTEWLIGLDGETSDDWETDVEIAEADLREELQPSEPDDAERMDAIPPPWLEDDDDAAAFDEFDVPDLEFAAEPDAHPFPRYQIFVVFPEA